jgi:hypothetical protein
VPEIASSHRETWTVTITRQPGDHWADLPVPHGRDGQTYLPDQISVFMTRGGRPQITVRGRVRNAGGMPGKRTVRQQFYPYMGRPPAWVIGAARYACETEGLGAEQTGCPW